MTPAAIMFSSSRSFTSLLVILQLSTSWLVVGQSNLEGARHQQLKEMMNVLGLESMRDYRVPVHVNLIFIGFDSKLQHSASVSTETLKEYLEAVDGDESFLFKHSYFMEREYFAAGYHPEKSHVVDDIVLDLQTQVVELAPLTHMAMEAALKTFVRLESKTDGSSYQLDADKMGSLLESLLHATNLSDFYTLFIINPGEPINK